MMQTLIENIEVITNGHQDGLSSDTISFDELFAKQINALYLRALRMTRNQEDAEDLVQDTALRGFQYFDKFKKDTNFGAWIFRILANNFINTYRKKKKKPYEAAIDIVLFKIEQEGTSFWDRLNDRSEAYEYSDLFDDDINVAIDKLPDEYKLVVLLSDVEDMNYKEIVEVLSIPMGTVMSRLYRGRKMLRKKLKNQAKEIGIVC